MTYFEKAKAPFSQPCRNCGTCCRMQLCPVAEILFEKEGCVEPPCPALVIEDDKALCGLVMGEQAFFGKDRHLVSRALGIGCGCSMPDEDTAEEQIRVHDEKANRMMNGALGTRV